MNATCSPKFRPWLLLISIALLGGCNDDDNTNTNKTYTYPDPDHPRVVSAVSISNTEVLVSFSEQMQGGSDSTENPAHYRITQYAPPGSATPLEATVTVVEAELLPERTSVRLTTLSQSGIEYLLTVTNVTDRDGNQIAAPGGDSDPSTARFVGTPPDANSLVDSDEDGLPDSTELQGWNVTVFLASGETATRHVTSNPFDADTDGDGIGDVAERDFGVDPRASDTDGDELTDYQELTDIYSSPVMQDTDSDTLQDGLEFNFFRTSALLADTDGDQLLDFYEIIAGNRDPLLADLPQPRIRVGNVNLQLDTRFSYTDETGESRTTEETAETTLTQSEDETYATSDTNSTKSTLEVSRTLEAEVKFPKGGGVKSSIGVTAGLERGYTSTFGTQSTEHSEETYHESLTTQATVDVSKSVTREVIGASMKADITVENTSDIPFTISNLELTAQTQDPRDRRRLIPLASLVPENPSFSAINIGTLGDPGRGPFVFAAPPSSVFPQEIERLLKSPRGLIVKLANFDITDEEGRNFVFTSQDVLDRTAGISIDFGDGRVESYRVATASTHDYSGRPRGITMEYALTRVIGLTKYPTIRDGGNGVVETSAAGDDEQVLSVNAEVEPGGVIIRVGPNGVLDTAAAGDDGIVAPDYAVTSVLRDTNNDGIDDASVEVLTRVRDVESGTEDLDPNDGLDERETFWVVFSSKALDPRIDFDDLVLRSGDQINIAFVRDFDKDGVWAREEYLHGSSDRRADTDFDGLTDKEEIQDGWMIQIRGAREASHVYPNPVQEDSDREGVLDPEERDCGLDPRQRDTDIDGLSDWEELFGQFDRDGAPVPMEIRDPLTGEFLAIVPQYSADVILDGGNGTSESILAGDDVFEAPSSAGSVVISSGPDGILQSTPGGDDFIAATHDPFGDCNTALEIAGFATDPLNDDTDGDLIPDGAEFRLGINPNNPSDGPLFLDDDGDGVPNLIEEQGFTALINGVEVHVNSSKYQPDSDSDGLPDLLEYLLASNPQDRDTDGDGLADFNEYANGDTCLTLTRTSGDPCVLFKDRHFDNYQDFLQKCDDADICFLDESQYTGNPGTNLNERDSDYDGVDDPDELKDRTIAVNGELVMLAAPVSDPLHANSDADLWDDGEELIYGTDPRNSDTDGDTTPDSAELIVGTNPIQADQKVTFQYSSIVVIGCEDGDGSNPEFVGDWRLTKQGQPTETVFHASGSSTSLGTDLLNYYGLGPVERTYLITPNDTVSVDTAGVYEDDCDCPPFDSDDDVSEISETFGGSSGPNMFPLKTQVATYDQTSDGDTCLRTTLSVVVAAAAEPLFAIIDTAETDEDTPVVVDVTSNDLLGVPPTIITLLGTPANGTVSITDPSSTVTYTPDADFNGSDNFTYTIMDATGLTSTGSVAVAVLPVNDGIPLAVDDTVTTPQDTPFDTGNLFDNDILFDNADLSTFDTTSANGGTVSYIGEGVFHYVPPGGFTGDDTFTYTLIDVDGDISEPAATVTVTVTP